MTHRGGGSIVTCRLEDVSRGNGFLTNAGVFLVVIATVLAQVLYDKHGIERHITAYPDNYCPQRIKAQFSSVGTNPVVKIRGTTGCRSGMSYRTREESGGTILWLCACVVLEFWTGDLWFGGREGFAVRTNVSFLPEPTCNQNQAYLIPFRQFTKRFESRSGVYIVAFSAKQDKAFEHCMKYTAAVAIDG